MTRCRLRVVAVVTSLIVFSIDALSTQVAAEQVFQLRNGLTLRGLVIELPTLKEGFGAAAMNDSNVRPVWLIDDGLRRTYIHGKSMSQARPSTSPIRPRRSNCGNPNRSAALRSPDWERSSEFRRSTNLVAAS